MSSTDTNMAINYAQKAPNTDFQIETQIAYLARAIEALAVAVADIAKAVEAN